MKNSLVVAAALCLQSFAHADTPKTAKCKGLQNDEATITVTELGDGNYRAVVKFVNHNLPNGTVGVFKLKRESTPGALIGPGTILGKTGQLFLGPVRSNGTLSMSLYASGDQRIELGYGAHLTCR